MISLKSCLKLARAAFPLAFLSLTAPLLHAHELHICKQSDSQVSLNGQVFDFVVSGGILSHPVEYYVPAGQCRYILTGAGTYTIYEEPSGNTVLTSFSAVKSNGTDTENALLSTSNLAHRTAVVSVVEGFTTTVHFTNSFNNVEGRWTGGGSIFTSTGVRVTHGFELHCDPTDLPNNLTVTLHTKPSNTFKLTTLTSAYCYITSNGTAVIVGVGTGEYNGVAGYTIHFTMTDAGEPGVNDYASFDVTGPGGTVIDAAGNLDHGNQEFHPAH